MKILRRKTNSQILLPRLKEATSAWDRMVGLLTHQHLSDDEGLRIHDCNSIHTFFMKFPIDCIFVDKHLRVVKVVESIPPFRMTMPFWKADSVIELNAGWAKANNIQVGEQLDVGD